MILPMSISLEDLITYVVMVEYGSIIIAPLLKNYMVMMHDV